MSALPQNIYYYYYYVLEMDLLLLKKVAILCVLCLCKTLDCFISDARPDP